MSEVVVHDPSALVAKMDYAKSLSHSNLLPKSYQGNPANLLFALEYADALGVQPIHAITSIHVISGKPTASADLMASVVRRAGHKLRVAGDDTYAEATLIRADDPDFAFTARWDLAKARTAGLNTPTWKNYPGAMLRSRAITEVIRAGAPDAMFGLVYSPEELGAEVDGAGKPVETAPGKHDRWAKPAPRKPVSISEAMGRNQPEPEPEPLADLGERRDYLAEAEAADGDADKLRALWIDAKAAGEPQPHLDTIAAMAAPVETPAS
jgi:hypothetical protein